VNIVLVTIGIVCIVAGLVGGELKLGGAMFPAVRSPVVRVSLVVVGVGTLLLGLFAGRLVSAKPAAQEDRSTTATSTGSTASAPPTSAAGPEQPLWHGTILLGTHGIDFTTDPPRIGDVNDLSIDILYYSPNNLQGSVFTGTGVAKWTQPGEPSPADCASLLATHRVSNATFDRQDRFCVGNGDSGRIVIITFLGRQDTEWEIDATVWRPRN
jgi:hypothetical protein